jgi:hypothetical protein
MISNKLQCIINVKFILKGQKNLFIGSNKC